jgi:hypothetical protein
MPLKKRAGVGSEEADGSDASPREPLIPAAGTPPAQRTVSVVLPTPFREAAGVGHPDGLVPIKRAGGVFKDKYGK